jgi:hypothetical protein
MAEFDKDTLFPIEKDQFAKAKHELIELHLDYQRYILHHDNTDVFQDRLGDRLDRMKELMKKLKSPNLKAKDKRLNNLWLKYAIEGFKKGLEDI